MTFLCVSLFLFLSLPFSNVTLTNWNWNSNSNLDLVLFVFFVFQGGKKNYRTKKIIIFFSFFLSFLSGGLITFSSFSFFGFV